jgi:hypothetical protein
LTVENKDDKSGASSDADTTDKSAQPGSQPNDDKTASSADDANLASSANEQDGPKPKTALEAAQAAIAVDDAKKTGTQDNKGAAVDPAASKKPEGEVEPTDEELEKDIDKLSENAQKRIKTLSRRLKEANQRVTAAEQQFKPGHENFERLVQFTRTNGLAAEEVQQGLTIMALMKNDPVRALEMLKPHLEGLNAFVGNILPADIQRQVDAGELTEAHARQLVAARNETERVRKQAEASNQRTAEEREQDTRRQLASDMTSALNTFEAELKASHPDYGMKRSRFFDKVQLGMMSERPKTVEEARAVAKKAWETVQEEFKGLGIVTPKPPVDPVRTDGKPGGLPANSEPPKTALEAAQRALGES